MTDLVFESDGELWPGHVVATPDSKVGAAFVANLPLEFEAVQCQWSKDMLISVGAPGLSVARDEVGAIPYQWPGLLVYEPRASMYALCYGEGRLYDGFGVLRPTPLAEIRSGLPRLHRFGREFQFKGHRKIVVRVGRVEEEVDDSPVGEAISITLDRATARAIVLTERSPATATAFLRKLPLSGFATNTITSGPLTRFWDSTGGSEGLTSLDVSTDETVLRAEGPYDQERRWGNILWPGFLYYKPSRPIQGIRIATHAATTMRGISNESSKLVPVAQLTGHWRSFAESARTLQWVGALDMLIERG